MDPTNIILSFVWNAELGHVCVTSPRRVSVNYLYTTGVEYVEWEVLAFKVE